MILYNDTSAGSQPISVTTAICLGLIASFIQSLGLTIQRKSHLQNDALPTSRRRSEWKRPLWLIGFTIFLAANVGGTVFQIGALPIVMLAPLGAVSLLYNALLARFLLNDFLSKFMVMGTTLIATGAVLIGYFGVVPSPPHNLDELLDLYARTTFVAFATIFTFLFMGVLFVAHLAEWQLQARIYRSSFPPPKIKIKHRTPKARLRRRWSVPTLAPVAEVSESSSGIATPVLAKADEAARHADLVNGMHTDLSSSDLPECYVSLPRTTGSIRMYGTVGSSFRLKNKSFANRRDYGSISRGSASDTNRKRKSSIQIPHLIDFCEPQYRMDADTVKKTKLGLAVAYGGASGTLSGTCLLLAKSGVELLLLSLSGSNQFGRWQSWFLILILLAAAFLQLWYLNKALKLAGPTLICPLAFCFYNTSSIALGLVYFDQIGALAWYDILAVLIGTAVLLSGVWIVSLHSNDQDEDAQPPTSQLSPSRSSSDTCTSLVSALTGSEPNDSLLPTETTPILSNSNRMFGDLPESSWSTGSSHLCDLPISTSPDHATPHTVPPSAHTPSSTPVLSSMNNKSKRKSPRRRPTITLDYPVLTCSVSNDLETQHHSSTGQGAEESSFSPTHSRRSSSSLYNVLEHGLSIGLSPSSPGFHLQPRSLSYSTFGETSCGSLRRKQSPTRRVMSEADARHANQVDQQPRQGLQEPLPETTGSGFAILPDQRILSRRLEQIAAKSRFDLNLSARFKQMVSAVSEAFRPNRAI